MDSFELNKIIAAILMVALLIIGIGKLSDVIFHVEKPKTPGYSVKIEQATVVSSQTSSQPIEDKVDFAALIAMGDIAKGEKVFKKCAACHSIVKGGKNMLGQKLIIPMENKNINVTVADPVFLDKEGERLNAKL